MDQLPLPARRMLVFIGEHWLLLLVLFLVLVLVTSVVIFLIYRARKKPPAPAAGAAAAPPAPSTPPTGQLRAAWVRFLRRLPQAYRRSILNFEHFVVMGAAASGKSRIIDGYTDWRRQTKEFASSQPNDPDLPVYLASSEVVMEIPARILEDHSDAVYRSLNRLWRPIFRERGPTVIAVVDVMRMKESTPDVVVDLAEKMRGKINVISAIRGRPIEVRVALTHLDAIEGYDEFAAFCRDRDIPIQIAPPPQVRAPAQAQAQAQAQPPEVDPSARLDTWFEEMRAYLPTALTSLHSPDYRKIVTFLRKAPEAAQAIKPFLKALFQHEALVLDPLYGGIYFSSEPAGVANPLYAAHERGPGPDPQRRHAILSALFVGGSLTFMGVAFESQYTAWNKAEDALERYRPAHDPLEVEQEGRDAVCAFTSRKDRAWIDRHPDFFSSVRLEMRKRFSKLVREQFLVNRLKQVASKGTLADGIPMAARRSVYYLGLIHSDAHDRLELLAPQNLQVLVSMLELPTDTTLLTDYLANIDEADKKAVIDFDLPNEGHDAQDTVTKWQEFLDMRSKSLADGVLTDKELGEMQKSADELQPLVERFRHDSLTRYIAHHLDLAAGEQASYAEGKRRSGPLELYYESKYGRFLRESAWAKDTDLIRSLERILAMVKSTSLKVNPAASVEELVFQLEHPYDESGDGAGNIKGPVLRIKVEETQQEMVIVTSEWEEILRKSRAHQYVNAFADKVSHEPDQDIFFGADVERSLAPVIWNANGEMAVVFTGRGILKGRYTRAAYEKHIREAVLALARSLDRANIGGDLRQRVTTVVRDAVGRYGTGFHDEALRFIQAFDVQASSVEELRVALQQMSVETSAFQDFVVAVDRNTRLDGSGNDMLTPIVGSMAEFEPWHKVVDGGTAPELGKYKAILGQLLVDLGPPKDKEKEAGGGAAAAPPAATAAPGAGGAGKADDGPASLEKALNPAGRRYLAELLGEAGSYSALVDAWLASVAIPEHQRKPFRAPLHRLAELGGHDVAAVIRRVWLSEIFPGISALASRFPFDPTARDEATPSAMREQLHPLDGRFWDLYHRFIEPIAAYSDRPPYHPRAAVARAVPLPPHLFATVNAASALSSQLWDPQGNPKMMELQIATLRFDKDAHLRPDLEGKVALTLMYMNVGDSSVFNFNQKPSKVTVGFDWTKDLRSQVGVQLTDLSTKENTFPGPVVSNGTYWSFFHLLRLGSQSLVKAPSSARLYTWLVRYNTDNSTNDVVPVRFATVVDPWEHFIALARYAGRPREVPTALKEVR